MQFAYSGPGGTTFSETLPLESIVVQHNLPVATTRQYSLLDEYVVESTNLLTSGRDYAFFDRTAFFNPPESEFLNSTALPLIPPSLAPGESGAATFAAFIFQNAADGEVAVYRIDQLTSSVPEPVSGTLTVCGLGVLAFTRSRKAQR
jgi:hypothetical protein